MLNLILDTQIAVNHSYVCRRHKLMYSLPFIRIECNIPNSCANGCYYTMSGYSLRHSLWTHKTYSGSITPRDIYEKHELFLNICSLLYRWINIDVGFSVTHASLFRWTTMNYCLYSSTTDRSLVIHSLVLIFLVHIQRSLLYWCLYSSIAAICCKSI